jgi:hypothetical protein
MPCRQWFFSLVVRLLLWLWLWLFEAIVSVSPLQLGRRSISAVERGRGLSPSATIPGPTILGVWPHVVLGHVLGGNGQKCLSLRG